MAATCALAACASQPTEFGASPEQAAQRETAAALKMYAQLLSRQDAVALSELFLPSGSMEHVGQAPIVGRAKIRSFLESFANYRVLSHDMTLVSVSPASTQVSQSGTYVQSVRAPDGQEIVASGLFDIQWRRQQDGRWLIERLRTSSQP
ncbi:MAG: nuclear transport factor 2 family protein [Proteobacteria bacterium]|nr:nuclear transport factor 2 family protein [Pseudomonadota bacterium]